NKIPVGPDWLSYPIEISQIFGSSWTDPTRSDHDREPTSTDSFLGPTDAVTGESIGYCQIQTDPTEEPTNVGRSPVGSRFGPDRKPLLLPEQGTEFRVLECLVKVGFKVF